MGKYRIGPPPELVLALQKNIQAQDFIETGTFLGGTAAWASGHFENVTSIELSPGLYAGACKRFYGQSNVKLVCGDSPAILKILLTSLKHPAIFWLDAHWSTGETAGRESECPVLSEIAAVNSSSLEHIILVDDARLFCAPPPRPHQAEHWPDLFTLITALSNANRRFIALVDDVLVAVPRGSQAFISALLQDMATITSERGPRKSLWQRIFR